MFWGVCLFVRQQDYLQTNERIRMKLLLEVCLGPRNNLTNFGHYPDYDLDPLSDPHPDPIYNHFAKDDSVVSVTPIHCCAVEACSP